LLQLLSKAPVTEYPLELFFDLSPDLLCIAGYDGYFKRINPAVSKLLGYTEDELYSSPINSFVYHSDSDLTEQMRNELRNNKPLLNFENRYVTKSGEVVWLSWTSLPVHNQRLVFAIAKNITHKKKVEEERNELVAKLTEANKDLRHLTYTTSHDLRSPVGNLLSVFELLDVSKISDTETLEFIEFLKLASETLKERLDNYVDALGEKDELHATTTHVDIALCLSHVLRSLKQLAQSAGAVINTNFTAFTHVHFNAAYMESILLNLITNAIKYARPGVAPVINISTQQKDGVKQLVFSDNGIGFDLSKVKDKLFGLYQKFTDHSDSKGVGLYLVHTHVTSMGGSVDVESKPNMGAAFTITFKN